MMTLATQTTPAVRRVLMSADCVGGVWTYAMELARALAAREVEVALAVLGGPMKAAQRAQALDIPGLSLHESDHRLEWMEDPWQDLARAGNWLLDLEAEIRPDIVHLNHFAHGDLPWHAPKLVVGHSCVFSWWMGVHGDLPPDTWARYRQVVRAGLQAADLVVAPSRTMLTALRAFYGPLPESRVIANGRTLRQFTPRSKEAFVFAGGRLWDEAKNIQLLAQAAQGLDWPVMVAGDTRHPDGGRVDYPDLRLLGPLSQSVINSYFGRAAIYALPARYEPFGLSVLEAGLSGCALVLGDIPSLRENWDGAAVFVSPDDPDELHRVLQALIKDAPRRQILGLRARARASGFSTDAMADAYLAAYAQAIDSHASLGQVDMGALLGVGTPANQRIYQ